jgi:hypothetical protein
MSIPVLWLQRFHAGATVVWIVLMGPSLLWLSESVPWLVAMSVWANVAGHFAGWMGARSEAAQTDTNPPVDTPRRPRLDTGRRVIAWRHGQA